mgnify:CR=1 FL=1
MERVKSPPQRYSQPQRLSEVTPKQIGETIVQTYKKL